MLLEAAGTMQDRSSTVRDDDQDGTEHLQRELLEAKEETIAELKDRVASFERQMEAEREARRRADTIIARLAEANAVLADWPRELVVPEEALDASETGAEASEGAARGAPIGCARPFRRTLRSPKEVLRSWHSAAPGGAEAVRLRVEPSPRFATLTLGLRTAVRRTRYRTPVSSRCACSDGAADDCGGGTGRSPDR